MSLDLVVVVPDKDTEQAFEGLLQRHQSLGIRLIRYGVIVHPHKDPGCYKSGDQLAAAFIPRPNSERPEVSAGGAAGKNARA